MQHFIEILFDVDQHAIKLSVNENWTMSFNDL